MPSFLSCRAAIRAHVTASAAAESAALAAASARDEGRAYLALAGRFLEPAQPRLLAIGGLSGTGKTSLAMALGPSLGHAPGALVLRSDVIRKRLFGVSDDHRLGPDGYRPDVTARVYRTLREEAALILDAGHGVIAEAVHAGADERAAIEEVARQRGVAFVGLWLEAPRATLTTRIQARRADASDATVAVLDRQLGYALGDITWQRLDASGPLDAVTRTALTALS